MAITAVDYDPFAKQATPAPSGKVEPVDYDPFAPPASAPAAQPSGGLLSNVWEGAKEGAGNVVAAGKDMLAAGADQAREIWSPPIDQGHAAPGALYSLGTLGRGAGEFGDVFIRALQSGVQVPAAMLRSEANTLSEKVTPAAGFAAGGSSEILGSLPERGDEVGGLPHVARETALRMPIDPQDIHAGDLESPIPTQVIAAGRKIVRESTENPPTVAPTLAIPPAPDAAALGLDRAPEQAGQSAGPATPYIGAPQEPTASAAAPVTSGPTPAQMADVNSLLSQDNTEVAAPQSVTEDAAAPAPVTTSAPAPAEPPDTGRPAPAEPDYSQAKTRAQTYAKWLDDLDGERRSAAATSPMAGFLRTTEASILNKVGGVESRLTNAAAARLADVRGALDELLNPVGDSPDMARVRAAMVEQHQKMADAAAPPPIAERSPAAEPDPAQAQPVAAEQPHAATATQPEPAPAQEAPQPVSAAREIAPEIPTENNIVTPAPETVGDGTREAPIEVSHPDHLAAAREVVDTATTPAQDGAGNYQSAHVKIHGLDITIQKPLGSVRTGIGADGKPWESPPLKADYGHIKGTLSGDGEPVDVFVGPNPASSRVYVIDQRNAETGAHDESKAMMGFNSQAEAVDAYRAAFSDGKADQRIGGVTDINTVDFKRLLKKGALDRPLAPSKGALKITAPAKVEEFKPVANTKEIITSANKTGASERNSAPEEITPAKPVANPRAEPLTERQFQSQYVQHVDLRGRASGKALETRDSVLQDGFKKGANVNAMPPSRAGDTGQYAPRKGDVVYLAPKGAWKDAPNGPEIQNGWKPGPHEAVHITDPSRSMYENYREAWNAAHSADSDHAPLQNGGEGVSGQPEPAAGKMAPKGDVAPVSAVKPQKSALNSVEAPSTIKPTVKTAVGKDGTAEAPPVTAEPKPRALALKPLEGTGEERSRAINAAPYRAGEERPQKEAAEKLVAEDPDGAEAVAMLKKRAPPDVHPEFVYMALESKATREGDTALAERLKQSRIAEEATSMGQRIGAWKNRDPLSAVSHMQTVDNARTAVLEQKTGGAAKAITAETREITKDVQAARKQARALTPRQKWAQTIAAITCKA